jgi:hypothetical protein
VDRVGGDSDRYFIPCGSRRGVECVLALALFAAAGSKAYQILVHATSTLSIFLSDNLRVACGVQAEILLGIWLLIGGLNRSRFIASLGCFTLFACIAFYEATHAIPSCGCFGNVKVPPLATGSFDLLAITGLWFTRPFWNSTIDHALSRWRVLLGLTLALLLSAGLWSAYVVRFQRYDVALAANDTAGTLVVLEPSNWVNKPFPLVDEIDNWNQLRSGRWLVIFYHFDCDSCLKAIPQYQAFAASELAGKAGIRVAFIAMPPASAGADPVRASSEYQHLALRPDHDWFATTPVAVALENGRVIEAKEGENAIVPPEIAGWRR